MQQTENWFFKQARIDGAASWLWNNCLKHYIVLVLIRNFIIIDSTANSLSRKKFDWKENQIRSGIGTNRVWNVVENEFTGLYKQGIQ